MPDIDQVSQQGIGQVIAKRQERARIREGYRALLGRIVMLALALYLVFTFGFLITQHHGQGMTPALKDGDLCIIFRRQAQTLMGQQPASGDVVAYRAEGKRYIGRVAAMPGDTVRMDENGSVSVSGGSPGAAEAAEKPMSDELTYPFTVPQGCLYVLGDNRTDTRDSRDFGLIPMESVEGKVITILRRRGL